MVCPLLQGGGRVESFRSRVQVGFVDAHAEKTQREGVMA